MNNRVIKKGVDVSSKVSSPAKAFIGCKIILAIECDECTFLETVKGENCEGRETRPGYKVSYPDGYISWSPKETFELAYRPITEEEKALI